MVNKHLKQELNIKLTPVVNGDTIIKMQEEVKTVKIGQDLIQYVVKIINDTRYNSNISLGASPRATLALIRVVQAEAYIRGRSYCIPDDIIKMLIPVISHRIILSAESKLSHNSVEKVLKDILNKIPVPVLVKGLEE